MWIGIVKDRDTQMKVEAKLHSIFETLRQSQDVVPLGTLGGYSGIILFLYYYYLHTKQDEHKLILNHKIEFILSELPKIKLATFCNGLAGLCWLIRFLHKECIINSSNINDALSEVDGYIFQHMKYEFNRQNIDFLHGGLGMAYYFLLSNNLYRDIAITETIEALERDKICNSDGSVKWLSETYVNFENQGFVCNLSLSHGMASIVAYLTKVVEITGDKRAREMLYKSTLFFKNNTNPPDYASTFSKWINDNDDNKYNESSMSWCYGDPGIAQALLRSGQILKDDSLIALSLHTLLKAAKRTTDVSDVCFCHGSASLCHIFNSIYQQTNNKHFEEAALFWLNETIIKGENSNQAVAGYIFSENEYLNNKSLLSGLSGVGLSLLSSVDSVDPLWDECLLLN